MAVNLGHNAGKICDILIGIPVFNRKNVVAATARSVSLADDISSVKIRVIDNGSSEFGSDFLVSSYPKDACIVRNESPTGTASVAARLLMQAFLQGPESILIILDSDLIVARDFLRQAREKLPLTEGLLSLLNAHTHPGSEEGHLVRKSVVGFAGTVWNRRTVEEVLAKVTFTDYFDDRICDYLRAQKRGIFALKNSAVQHIGLVFGENSTFSNSDFGLSFTGDEWYNLAAINETFLQGIQQEFREVKMQQAETVAVLTKEIQSLRHELKLLRKGAALYAGHEEQEEQVKLAWRQRAAAVIARMAFAFLRFSTRPRARTEAKKP